MPYEIAIVNPRKVSKKKKPTRSVASVVRAAAASVKTNPRDKVMAAKKKGKKARKKAVKPKTQKRVVRKTKVKKARRKTGRRPFPKGWKPAEAYTLGSDPIKRRRLNPRRAKLKRKHHKRHKRHHNPRFLPGFTNQLTHGAMGAAGALGVNIVLGYLPLPASLKTGLAGKAVKLVGAAGVGMLAGRFMGAARGQAIAQGAITVALYDMFKGLLNQAAPNIPVLAGGDEFGYLDPATTISGDDYMSGDDTYLPAGVSGSDDFGAYMSGDDNTVGAYMSGDSDY